MQSPVIHCMNQIWRPDIEFKKKTGPIVIRLICKFGNRCCFLFYFREINQKIILAGKVFGNVRIFMEMRENARIFFGNIPITSDRPLLPSNSSHWKSSILVHFYWKCMLFMQIRWKWKCTHFLALPWKYTHFHKNKFSEIGLSPNKGLSFYERPINDKIMWHSS